MYRDEIDEKLIELREILRQKNGERDDLEVEINDLESEIDEVDSVIDAIEGEIDRLENELIEAKERVDCKLTGNKFKDAFIKCSYFCSKHENSLEQTRYVKIEEDKLLALDGYRGLIIKLDDIPEELKNTSIKWDIRDEFEANARTDIDYKHDLKKSIKDGKSDIKINMSLKELSEKYSVGIRNSRNGEVLVLKYIGEEIGFNKRYFDTLLWVFENQNTTIYYPATPIVPMIVKSSEQAAILLPVRLEYCK